MIARVYTLIKHSSVILFKYIADTQTSCGRNIGKFSKISFVSFYVCKIYLKRKRDFDQTNTILEILEHCIEYDPSEQERRQDNM